MNPRREQLSDTTARVPVCALPESRRTTPTETLQPCAYGRLERSAERRASRDWPANMHFQGSHKAARLLSMKLKANACTDIVRCRGSGKSRVHYVHWHSLCHRRTTEIRAQAQAPQTKKQRIRNTNVRTGAGAGAGQAHGHRCTPSLANRTRLGVRAGRGVIGCHDSAALCTCNEVGWFGLLEGCVCVFIINA